MGIQIKLYAIAIPQFTQVLKIVVASEQHRSYYFTGCTCYFPVCVMKSIAEIIHIWTK